MRWLLAASSPRHPRNPVSAPCHQEQDKTPVRPRACEAMRHPRRTTQGARSGPRPVRKRFTTSSRMSCVCLPRPGPGSRAIPRRASRARSSEPPEPPEPPEPDLRNKSFEQHLARRRWSAAFLKWYTRLRCRRQTSAYQQHDRVLSSLRVYSDFL